MGASGRCQQLAAADLTTVQQLVPPNVSGAAELRSKGAFGPRLRTRLGPEGFDGSGASSF